MASPKPDLEYLKTQNTMTFFTPAGQTLPRNEKAARIVESRFSIIPKDIIQWLQTHDVTIEYHATRIEASTQVSGTLVAKPFTAMVSGLHPIDEMSAIRELMRQVKRSYQEIDFNKERLEKDSQSDESWDSPIEVEYNLG